MQKRTKTAENNRSVPVKKSPTKFFLLVFALSIPFWLIGGMAEHVSTGLPLNIPVSALGLPFCPLIAALILVYREGELGGIRRLLKRVFDYKRIKQKIWYVPTIFLMPAIMLLSYGVMRLMELPLPQPYIPFLAIPTLFAVFFIGAVGEETGWMGYAVDPMQDRWSALKTSIILGLVGGAIWHIVPLIQAHRTPAWITWQCFTILVTRILVVWLYNNTGKSVFAAILFHAMVNVSNSLFPNYGSHYDPAIVGLITAMIAVVVTFLWGSKTLAWYRYAENINSADSIYLS